MKNKEGVWLKSPEEIWEERQMEKLKIKNGRMIVMLRSIECELHGSEGLKPTVNGAKHCLHLGENSCISSSGNSLCGGYNRHSGEEGKIFVCCCEDRPARRKAVVK